MLFETIRLSFFYSGLDRDSISVHAKAEPLEVIVLVSRIMNAIYTHLNAQRGFAASMTRIYIHFRERKCADTIDTVTVPWAGHFLC